MEQSKLKEQYHSMAVSKVVSDERRAHHFTPLREPAVVREETRATMDDERSSQSSSAHRSKLLSQSQDMLADRKNELKWLLKRSREHNDMLRSELHTPSPIQLGSSSSARATPATPVTLKYCQTSGRTCETSDCLNTSGCKIHTNTWDF
jgi:hypothetical protein